MESIIETGVDRLIGLVKKKGKISFQDASEELGVGINLVEEWADFLDEEGLVSIQYKLTTPYIVERNLTKKETLAKAEEFYEKKDTFINRAEAMLSIIDREAKELQDIKASSEQIRKSMGLDFTKVKSELEELEKYEALKEQLHKKIQEKEQEFKEKMAELTNQILNEQRKYEDLLKSVQEEETKIEREKLDVQSIEEKEGLLFIKLKEFEDMIKNLRGNIKDEYREIVYSEKHAKDLKKFVGSIKSDIELQKSKIFQLLSEREKKEKKIIQLQEEISKKIYDKAENITTAKKASRAFREFFEKRLQITSMVDKLNKEREELRNELNEMIRKARIFKLSAKSDLSKEIQEIEGKFNEIDKNKNIFEAELKKFISFLTK